MKKGYVSFVLHSHLPWVLGHGRWPHGTDWLNEAAAECYIPLLIQLNNLIKEGHTPHFNIGITPVLQEQLQSKLFVNEFTYYLKNKIKAIEEDVREFDRKKQSDFLSVALMWKQHYCDIKKYFNDVYKKRLLRAFNVLQKEGYIEIMTSAATHGYLPLLKHDRSVKAQIQLGVNVYTKNFGSAPQGIWLPECAYRPAYAWKPAVGNCKNARDRKGIDEFLSSQNLKYFIIDSHLLKGGKAIGVYLARFKALKHLWKQFEKEFTPPEIFTATQYDVYLVSSNPQIKPIAVFTRDPETASQVWSGTLGYPGEPRYLDFHKKRFPGGLRYWRVTDSKADLAEKRVYEPETVEEVLQSHARHFVSVLNNISYKYYAEHKKPAFICVPFDTELFGHWWFEGPRWLYYVVKYIEEDGEISLEKGSTILDVFKPKQIVSLPEGSWGEGGFHYIWLNKWTEWTWERVYEAEDEFYGLLDRYKRSKDGTVIRILKQLARELLLLQSSDWQFLISTWSARDYAELRLSRHFESFKQLTHILHQKPISDARICLLHDIEEQDNCFADLDLSIFTET